MGSRSPRVLLLEGDNLNSLPIAKELSEDLDAEIIGSGTTPYSRLRRSKYCDVGVELPTAGTPLYDERLLDLIERTKPEMVVPVGYESMAAVERLQTDVPSRVSLCLPSSEAFHTAVDKEATLRCGGRLGFDTPTDYSKLVAEFDVDNRRGALLEALSFPVFLKARLETGGAVTGRVDDPSEFWQRYDRIADNAPERSVLVQECINPKGSTYGCGLFLNDNDVELLFSHEELRSVPRHGGSGTHLRIIRNPHLEAKSIQLLQEIGWNGIALVEYKRRADGTFVLMEINPKFWASYALASSFGYRFASMMVATVLNLAVDHPIGSPSPVGEMVFPLRELHQYIQNRNDESLVDCLSVAMKPCVARDFDFTDFRAWLVPPVEIVQKLPRTLERDQGRSDLGTPSKDDTTNISEQ